MGPQVEPYQRIESGGRLYDWYMLPFDKRGRCKGPRTRAELIDRASDETITDVFIFCHGWNNDWNVATKRYRDFITGYASLRTNEGLSLDREFNPLLVGVFWPSTALVFGKERGIAIAAEVDDPSVLKAEERDAETAALADELDSDVVERFYELVDGDELSDAEAAELAELLTPILSRSDSDEQQALEPTTPTDVVESWRSLSSEGETDTRTVEAVRDELWDFGRVTTDGDTLSEAGDLTAAAGILGKLDPRQIVRGTTVRLMKDRAGTIGAFGVAPFLVELLEATKSNNCRVHLVGHSYGAKVCLSAVCYPSELQRPVDSMLLLQPAVSHRCFADDDRGRGGYADAPRRVQQPILATFSKNDIALRRLFQLALWRGSDKDELKIAAGDEPSRFAALGGYGPRGLGNRSKLIDVKLPGAGDSARYTMGEGGPAVYGVDATSTIGGHGDIDNESTWWALDNLVAAERRSSV